MSADPLKLDVGPLAAFLKNAVDLPNGELTVSRLGGGQSNPTYVLHFDGRPTWVLRKKPPGKLLPSAHAVGREHRVMKALAETGVPVPHMVLHCEDAGVVGTEFFIMEHVEGRTFWDPRLPELDAASRGKIFDEMNRTLAALHAVDPDSVGLGDFGRPGNYFTRQIDRWTRQYRASETDTIEAMDNLAAWLPQHIPQADDVCIVHGDYRLDNVLFHPQEPVIVAVLDWELSTLGHPLADLAYHAMTWRMPADLRGLAGADLALLGIPDERSYVETYLKRARLSSFDEASWEFAMAYNLFRVAAIRQGVMRRALDGNAANERASEAGKRARHAACLGWEIVERIERRGSGDLE